MQHMRSVRHTLWLPLAVALTLAMAGCGRRSDSPPVSDPSSLPRTGDPGQATQSVAVVEPDQGETLRLSSGAELSLPPQSVSQKAVVTLRAVSTPDAAPIPRSMLGQAYEFSLEGGSLSGVAVLKLPIPAGLSMDQYDLAPYRWSGATWERINGRATAEAIQFGSSEPGRFALQGRWRLADATLSLALAEPAPGQLTVPIRVTGQYRYTALPTLHNDHIQARLMLKQDTSGGAGQTGGNEALDRTVDEAVLRLKPDLAQPQGRLEFSQVFELLPGQLDLPLGDTIRIYSVLTVDDSATPTRRLSTGIEYAYSLPIQIVGNEIVRPRLVTEGQNSLRWHVWLNGQTLSLLPADELTLDFNSVLARGGLGDYRFTLESEIDGAWTPVSNEVAVQLALRPTEPPPLSAQQQTGAPTTGALPGPGATALPTAGSSSRPATPTRRASSIGSILTPSPTPSPGPVTAPGAATPTATRPAWANVFWADRYILTAGECTILHWQVENVISVFLDGSPVTGSETRQVCPAKTTAYSLRVTDGAGTQYKTVTITVGTSEQAAIEFTADDFQVASGQCTTLHWRVTNVRAVYLDGVGVPGESTMQVCPTTATEYTLRVEGTGGTVTTRKLTISISADSSAVIRFWAEQYQLPAQGCTTLHWKVQNVQEVRLDEAGVAGTGAVQACPGGQRVYTLKTITTDGRTLTREITLDATEQAIGPSDVIAQGVVNEVARAADIDPLTISDQPGYRVVIDGVNPLAAYSGWSQTVVTLLVPEASADQALLDPAGATKLNWPIGPTQLVEFRALCQGASCSLNVNAGGYLLLRSE